MNEKNVNQKFPLCALKKKRQKAFIFEIVILDIDMKKCKNYHSPMDVMNLYCTENEGKCSFNIFPP